ncbi:hypothetical protein L7F22_009841 [Adiantum nelumboides]|nr:hypothetical protein [Adiantum nelumboides]
MQLHFQDDGEVLLHLSSRREVLNIATCADGQPGDGDAAPAGRSCLFDAPRSSTATAVTTAVLMSDDVEGELICQKSLMALADSGGAEAMATFSSDPRSDFVRSMCDMMQAMCPTQLQQLEALLECYLRLNTPALHATIALTFLSALATCTASSNCTTSAG